MGNAVQALPVQAVRDTEMFELALCAAIPIYEAHRPGWDHTWWLEAREPPQYYVCPLIELVVLSLQCAALNWCDRFRSSQSEYLSFRNDFASDFLTQIEVRRANQQKMRIPEGLVRELMKDGSTIVDLHKSLSTKRIWYALATAEEASARLAEFKDFPLHSDFLDEFRKEYEIILMDSVLSWLRAFRRIHPDALRSE